MRDRNRSRARRRERSAAPYLLERAVNAVSTPMAVFDREGREIVRNRALGRLVGRGDRDGILGRMRATAREAGRGPTRTEHRTRRGGFTLRGRPLEPGGLLNVAAVIVALEPA